MVRLPPLPPRLVRLLFLLLGWLALGLGLLGVFLPLLPTTPFVLLAAFAFARSSPGLHGALLAHRVTGPILREWQEHRSMPPGVKPWAFVLMAASFGVSLYWVEAPWHRLFLVILALILAYFLWRVPVRAVR